MKKMFMTVVCLMIVAISAGLVSALVAAEECSLGPPNLNLIWLQQEDTIQVSIGTIMHEIKVIDVNDAGTKCGVSIDGDVLWIDNGNYVMANNVVLGVIDINRMPSIPQDSDSCMLNFYCISDGPVKECSRNSQSPDKVTIHEGRTIDVPDGEVDHQISVFDIDDSGTMCGVSVDGDITWLARGQRASFNGVALKLNSIYSIGSNKLGRCDLEYYCIGDSITCTDSDGGKDYYTKGSTRLADGSGLNDDCRRNYVNGKWVNTGELLEAVCTTDGKTEYITYKCQDGCKDGACLSQPITPSPVKESTNMQGMYYVTSDQAITTTPGCSYRGDNDYDPLVKGAVTIPSGLKLNPALTGSFFYRFVGSTTYEDCVGDSLREHYCDSNSYAHYASVVCENGCKDGACIKGPVTPPSPIVCTTEYDPVCGRDGRTYSNKCVANSREVQVAYRGECKETTYVTTQNINRISSVWSDTDAYEVGDRVKIYAKVVDSDVTPATPEEGTSVGFGLIDFNGNNLPEPFMVEYNSQTGYYEGQTRAPDTSPVRVIVTASKGTITTANRDYYFKVTNAVRVTVEPTVPEYLGPPEEAPEEIYREYEKKKVTREELLRSTVSCFNGCAADSKCLPFGTRLLIDEGLSYCGISQSFESQKAEGDNCQNSYECQSNQCSNSHCVDLEKELRETRGMLEKVMNWLSRLFGGKKAGIVE